MAKRKKRTTHITHSKNRRSSWQPSYWMIAALIVVFLAGGVMVNAIFTSGSPLRTGFSNVRPEEGANSNLTGQVQLVAANFRCACGGCGELFLIDCTCDMPRGAKEEKDFIRQKLEQGLSVDQVITLVDKEYGHRIS
ncbi:MAG: hypothetical protein PVG35_04205 [Desulfobacterales bacterium]